MRGLPVTGSDSTRKLPPGLVPVVDPPPYELPVDEPLVVEVPVGVALVAPLDEPPVVDRVELFRPSELATLSRGISSRLPATSM